MFYVVLKNVHNECEQIVLSKASTRIGAEDSRRTWRRLLGGDKRWVIERRPGLDTLDHLGLTILTELRGITEDDHD